MSSGRPTKNPFFTNPFFMVLLVVSLLFVFTALGYLVCPYALEKAPAESPSRRFAMWLDAKGPLLLTIEFVVMLASAVAAMATDDWFSRPGPSGHS
ncbi:MAG: hypothetical protein ABS79_02530 [Planctomycetes bacterium SCN 63-9]|nr:MAG: hypothetical protein ABS79_02530 [Planctomycetes bacterium SCN 63-9]